ncbi:uncharacterized protein [Rutidosis leptorrhynchoides]|uniref:uncharacterized protein n=1 Tax=Rutidosis leptorrhynchoides TaxID=125765 RepID=UPI003A98F098
MSWVKWDEVISSYGIWGLNIGSLLEKKLSLLCKWWWRFKNVPHTLWLKVITPIYGSGGMLSSSGSLRPQSMSGIWGNMVRAGIEVDKKINGFCNSFESVIGDGASTSFWTDPWLIDATLKDMFKRLFHLDADANETVQDRVE